MVVATHRKTIESFGKLSPAEKRFVEDCEQGIPTDISRTRPDKASDENTIRGGLIRYFLLGGCDQHKPTDEGITILGAYISEALNLTHCSTQLRLGLINCHFENELEAYQCKISTLVLNGSALPGLSASGALFSGDLFLRDNCLITGEVNLSGATLGGQLSCSGGSFENENGRALNAQDADIKGGVFLRNGFRAKGAVNLSGAALGGQLSCSGGSFENENGRALNAHSAEIKGGVFLDDHFSAKGEVNLSGAALGGALECSGGSFENKDGIALNAQGADIKGGVFLRNGFRAKGAVNLSGAALGGQLSCSGGSFENENGRALNAHSAEIKGGVFLDDHFSAKGEVSLSGAALGGQLACSGGSFENENGHALDAQNADIKGDVFLHNGFRAKGEVSLIGATLGGQLSCIGGSFENKDGIALNAQSADIKGGLIWKDVTCKSGHVYFAKAKSSVLHDEYGSWPRNRFFINGFEYETILASDLKAESRLQWLEAHGLEDFDPQPYEQLAKVLGEMGHRRDRALVLETMERKLRADIRNRAAASNDHRWFSGERSIWADVKRPFRWLTDHALDWVIGYGYRPSRAITSSFLIIGLTWFLAYFSWHQGDMVPNSDIILTSDGWKAYAHDRKGNAAEAWSTITETGRDYQTFYSGTYAADVFIPLIDFGQEEAWSPSTERGWWGVWLYWLSWIIKTLGWIITALGAAAVTGIIRQDR